VKSLWAETMGFPGALRGMSANGMDVLTTRRIVGSRLSVIHRQLKRQFMLAF